MAAPFDCSDPMLPGDAFIGRTADAAGLLYFRDEWWFVVSVAPTDGSNECKYSMSFIVTSPNGTKVWSTDVGTTSASYHFNPEYWEKL